MRRPKKEIQLTSYDELLGFLKNVSEEKDSYKKQREELCGRIYKYTDGNNSKRIAEFMKL